jgi:hypothetical protein
LYEESDILSQSSLCIALERKERRRVSHFWMEGDKKPPAGGGLAVLNRWIIRSHASTTSMVGWRIAARAMPPAARRL